MSLAPFESIPEVESRLSGSGYLPSREIATTVFLAEKLDKPVLVEGPAGVGKTELALALSKATGRPLVRLQCYEGLDESKALYEWEYAKQLLYTQLVKEKISETLAGTHDLAEAVDRIGGSESVFFSERFLLPRPVLKALLADEPTVLLVDEIDKADPEFEAFLLEVLSDFAVTVPEIGTFRARHVPRVILTSNAARELSDALKRRCLHLFIDYPTREREVEIVRKRVPGIGKDLAAKVVETVQRVRGLDLKKSPSIAETLDWARALLILNASELSPQLLTETLNVLLKHEADIQRAREQARELVQA
ncbi:AAA family ATPase [Vulgatibacter incomptus]|uniref:Carbon monoxide dehydrogenase D protein n=1 Tax=Vulgatibacter incomptus TaxID=1391653 RepID=A0A0K1PCA3_9BACT|nr:MoxR family ATPase [Vulgatibacter incomptus]AKU91046.1 carbon monoxide dehydrogenase D protein [Vulgatibacter incomptus]